MSHVTRWLVAFALLGSVAQAQNAKVVATCGTPPDTYTAGESRQITQNTTGKLCVVGATSGDVTAASSFGTDNVAIRSDGTGKGVQGSGVTIDDTAVLTAFNLNATSTAAGVVSTIQSTDAGATAGPTLSLYRNSASPAASDAISDIIFDGKDSGGTQTTYARIGNTISSPTDTAETGLMSFSVSRSGTLASRMTLTAGMTVGTVLNTNAGEIAMAKMTDAASAPGAGGAKFAVLCGTNAGTAKIVAYAGTSTTAVTVVDNVGTGVTGC